MNFPNFYKSLLFLALTSPTYANPVHVDTLTNETTDVNPQMETLTSPKADVIITHSIEAQIKKSKVLSPLAVKVSTENGVVTYSGTVASDSEASELIELAQATIGVENVNTDNLKIEKSTQPFEDMMITAKAKGLFIREKVFGTKDIAAVNISVETKNGVVYLTGAVSSQAEINNAIKLVEGIKGVKKVEYKVKEVKVNQTNDDAKEVKMNHTNDDAKEVKMNHTNDASQPKSSQHQ